MLDWATRVSQNTSHLLWHHALPFFLLFHWPHILRLLGWLFLLCSIWELEPFPFSNYIVSLGDLSSSIASFKCHQMLLTLAPVYSQNFKVVYLTVYVTSLLELSNMNLKIKPKTNPLISIPSNYPSSSLSHLSIFSPTPPPHTSIQRTLQVIFDSIPFFPTYPPSSNPSAGSMDSLFQSSISLHIRDNTFL